MRPHEYLRLCGKITGLAKKEIDDRAEELLDFGRAGRRTAQDRRFLTGYETAPGNCPGTD